MFQNKKFRTVFILQTILPFGIGLLGMFAFFFYHDSSSLYTQHLLEEYERAEGWFRLFYRGAIGLGVGLLIANCVIGIVSFFAMLIQAMKKEKEQYSIARPLTLWLWSGACNLAVLLWMLFVHTFTYGMGI